MNYYFTGILILMLTLLAFCAGPAYPRNEYLNDGNARCGEFDVSVEKRDSEYNNYNNSITSVAKIVAIKQGNTLIRVPGENSEVWSSQEWSFYVDDAVTFGNAFAELMKNVEPSGYVSLGQYTAGERGETHYIYATYPDYVSQLKSNVDTPNEQEGFVKFLEKIGPISTYRGSVTLRPIKGWN